MEKDNTAQTDNTSPISDNKDISTNQISIYDKDDAGLETNISRDRTFNKELSDLVSKIRSNEPREIIEPKAPKEITDDELLRMYHKLYYKAVNLTGLDKINGELNPFDLYKESSSDDLVNLIYAEMSDLHLPEYAILAYSLEKKCYICYTNHIDNLNGNNLVMDSLETLYTNITGNKNGIVLDHQSIERNLYLKKRFGSKKSVYFISFGDFFKDFYNDADFERKNNFLDYLLPILVIQLKENINDHQKKSIFNNIKNKLTVYFFLLYKKILLESQDLNIKDQNSLFNFIDYTYKKYLRYDDYLFCIIKFRNYINAESLYTLKYLQIKLDKKLADKTSVLRIEKDKLLIFTQKFKKKIIDEIMDDINKVHGNLFNINFIMNDENAQNIYLVQNIKEQIIK
ncbi:MAG: hypothetical protein JXN64_02980 [Spirochaetes bacterium]|nr:hypothetical protein [Spirochaetota bacterium]